MNWVFVASCIKKTNFGDKLYDFVTQDADFLGKPNDK